MTTLTTPRLNLTININTTTTGLTYIEVPKVGIFECDATEKELFITNLRVNQDLKTGNTFYEKEDGFESLAFFWFDYISDICELKEIDGESLRYELFFSSFADKIRII